MRTMEIRWAKAPNGEGGKYPYIIPIPGEFFTDKIDDATPIPARLFSTERRHDGYLVCVNWWVGKEQQSRPIGGPYDTEQEAEARALELTQREAAKRAITEGEGLN